VENGEAEVSRVVEAPHGVLLDAGGADLHPRLLGHWIGRVGRHRGAARGCVEGLQRLQALDVALGLLNLLEQAVEFLALVA
jgi:hypothetical protein